MTIVVAPADNPLRSPVNPQITDDPNSAAEWEKLRNLGGRGVPPEPCHSFDHRIYSTLAALAWCWQQRPASAGPPTVLDVGAGSGQIGIKGAEQVAKGELPMYHYAGVEQSPALCAWLKQQVPDASVAMWRYEPGGVSLKDAIGNATDVFHRAYFTVVLSDIIEHVASPYGLIDEAWSMTEPGGWLVAVIPKMDEHRTHVNGLWDWNRTLAVLRQYVPFGQPLVVWEYGGSSSDMIAAIPKPAAPSPANQPTHPVSAPAENGHWDAGNVRLAVQHNANVNNVKPMDDYLSRPPR